MSVFGGVLANSTYASPLQVVLNARAICSSLLAGPRAVIQSAKYQKVNVDPKYLMRWLRQFDRADRAVALDLLAQTHLIDYPNLTGSLIRLHEKVLANLRNDGFVSELNPLYSGRVDFTRAYNARSGDLISYFYRKTNRVRSAQFFNSEQLVGRGSPDRALVIVDDYTATGAQLLLEYLGSNLRSHFADYGKVYLAVMVANTKAITRVGLLTAGQHERVGQDVNSEFGLTGKAADEVLAAASAVCSIDLKLLFDRAEVPRFAVPDPRQEAFLLKYGQFEQNPSAPFGAGNAQGSTAFFYGAPNSLPDIFWNSLGTYKGKAFMPLFSRTEDISHYEFSKDLPAEMHVWGG